MAVHEDSNRHPRRMRQYYVACMGFGAMMGVVFPPFAFLFVARPGGSAEWFFRGACVIAGLIVGQIAHLLGKRLLLDFIRRPISEIQGMYLRNDRQRNRDGRRLDYLVAMRLDLEDTLAYIRDSAEQARQTGERIRDFNTRFGPALERIEDGAIRNRKLVETTDRTFAAYGTRLSDVVAVFQRQDEITDRVQDRISALGDELSVLAEEIRQANQENEEHTRDIIAESDRFLGAVGVLAEAAELIGGLARDIRSLAVDVSASAEDIREIGDMSARTQVLAINANIEAARAGDETGRGFRVIAGAVSQLADRSDTISSAILNTLSDLENRSISLAGAANEREQLLKSYQSQAAEAREAREQISRNLERSRELDHRVLGALESQEDEMRRLLDKAAEMNRNENELMENVRTLQEGFQGLAERGSEMMGHTDSQREAVNSIKEIYDSMIALSARASALADRFKAPG